jgi:glutamate--cysteine ligase
MLKFTSCQPISQFSTPQSAHLLTGIVRGYERECLRVDEAGQLARTPHPLALGSKLTHPWITTDYAEALLEFITPPSAEPQFALSFLTDVHRFSAQQLDHEVLWAGSMPCKIGADADIAIADYGVSHTARFKQAYRQGLSLRYGRAMQTIAGAHYNWSLPEAFWLSLRDSVGGDAHLQTFVDQRYFGLIRNFLRFGWLVPYLFGASPALCQTFLQGHATGLSELLPGTLYGPHATSLRMSDLGYQNHAQDKLAISFNSLDEYTAALETAIHTPDPYYQALGVRAGQHWKQLSDCVLQTESEFYAPIRPKRVGLKGERPALALKTYGVQYIEMRLFDLNPFIDIGIAPEQSLFADTLLLMCQFRDSPPITAREQSEIDENKRRVVNHGRQPDLQLLLHNQDQPLRGLAHELFDDMAPFAAMLDTAYGGDAYQNMLQTLRERIDHPELTPSSQVIEASLQAGSYFEFALDMSQKHTQGLRAQVLPAEMLESFRRSVQTSLNEQHEFDTTVTGSFEDFVAAYYA